MKTVYSNQEGVKMNANLDFGPIQNHRHEYLHFLTTYETMFDLECDYYFRITDNNFIQIACGIANKDDIEIKAQFKLRYNNTKDNITFAFKEIIDANLLYNGLPSFKDSSVFNHIEFGALINSITEEKDNNKKQALSNQTALILYLRSQNLNPTPSGKNPNSWIAKCPSGEQHFLQIVTTNDQWGCGYCKRKGGISDLKDWIRVLGAIREQRLLSQFMREAQGGKLSQKMAAWWQNRY